MKFKVKRYYIYSQTKFLYLERYNNMYFTWVVPVDRQYAITLRYGEGKDLIEKIGTKYGVLYLMEVE